MARNCLDVENDVVGGERQHHRLGIALARDRGRGGDGRAGIAPQRLDHHRRLDADLLGLAAGKEVEIRPGDDDRRRRTSGRCTRSRVSW